MGPGNNMPYVVREDAREAVIVALYLRQAIGIHTHIDVPTLRDAPVAHAALSDQQTGELERQWMTYFNLTVEPQAHASPVPLEMVDGFGTNAVLPSSGCEQLADAMMPFAAAALQYAAHARYRYAQNALASDPLRAYRDAISATAVASGREPQYFELNVEVLPLSQRGLWRIGSLTVAVTDSLRNDAPAFAKAIKPVIAELS